MPSAALAHWQNDRALRLNEVDAHCAAVSALVPPSPMFLDETLRGYVLHLSAHFQGPVEGIMATTNLIEPLKSGTFVEILKSGFHRAQIAECLGPLGPKGARVYRVRVSKKPRMYIEVLEAQLKVLDN